MTETRQPDDQQPTWQPTAGGPLQPQTPGYGYEAPAGTGHQYPASGPQGSPYGAWIPQQQGQWTPQAQSGWVPQQTPPPKNSLAVPALVVGIVALVLSPVPFINQLGILVGLTGLGLGIAALIIGLRSRIRVVMPAIALALSVLGLISAIGFTVSFYERLSTIGSTTPAAAPAPARSIGGSDSSSAPAATPSYTLSITGSAKRSSISWGVDGSSGSADESTPVPWTRTMSGSGNLAPLRRRTAPGVVLCGHAHTGLSATVDGIPVRIAPGVASTLRLPREPDPDTLDRDAPPGLALHVLDERTGDLQTHVRVVR